MFKRFLKFGLVGGFGTIVNLVIFALLTLAGVHPLISATVSFIVAATFNYILNSVWVFKDRGHKCTKTLWVKFMCVSVFSLCINLIVLWIFLSKINYLYSQAVGIACSMIFNFIGNNLITFKEKK
ncbi:GtrA family protein [bacterium]|nr:GtrA family protein [bacterium]